MGRYPDGVEGRRGMTARKKGVDRRDLILSRASRLFWEKGYTETSMKDIAGACGFRPANLYNFFESKESILYEMLLLEMNEIVTPIRPLKDDAGIDPVAALRRLIETHMRLTLGDKRASKLLFDVSLKNLSAAHRKKIIRLRDEYDEIGTAIVRRGVDSGVFSGAVDEKISVYAIASIIARSRIWFSPGGTYSIDDIIDFVFTFALNGLGAKARN